MTVARHLEKYGPGLQTVALHTSCEPAMLLELMRAGVREFLYPPFSTPALREALVRVKEIVDRTPSPVDSTDLVFTFLPSKPGVGTSTVALNASAAMATVQDAKVLIADFDLNSGLIGFMLKLDSPYSLVHAAESSANLDESLWQHLVSSIGRLDVLPSGKLNPGFRIEPAQIRTLMDFARRHYKAICLDLSGNMEKYSIELMHESKRIFLVCTQELPSLHLAREKLSYLRTLELEERVSLVLNRTQKRAIIGPEEVEKLLGHRVDLMYPNDYAGVHNALAAGKCIDPSTELGRRFRAMAESILAKKPIGAEPKNRFVEYFSLLPARYSLSHAAKKSGD
jgi:pilus assembly protein CpaE